MKICLDYTIVASIDSNKMAPRARIQTHTADSQDEFIDIDDHDGLSSDSDLNPDDAHVTRPSRSHGSNTTRAGATGTVEKVVEI